MAFFTGVFCLSESRLIDQDVNLLSAVDLIIGPLSRFILNPAAYKQQLSGLRLLIGLSTCINK